MDICTLVSTMNNTKEIISKMNIKGNAVIVNQNSKLDKKIKNDHILWINSTDIGLSKSRNIAIQNSFGDISVIADDDLIYVDNYTEVISDAFNDNLDSDILVFKVEGINKKFKSYKNKAHNINFLSSLKVSSVQIAFRNKSIKGNISFNEFFGAGAKYTMGEENIFLYQCLKAGLKIKFVPLKIADLYIGDSSWFTGFDKKYLFDRGASYYAMSKTFYKILITQFAIRKRKLFSPIGVIESIKIMSNGAKDYKSKTQLKKR